MHANSNMHCHIIINEWMDNIVLLLYCGTVMNFDELFHKSKTPHVKSSTMVFVSKER